MKKKTRAGAKKSSLAEEMKKVSGKAVLLTPNELKLLRFRCIATKRSMSSSDCAGHSGDDGAIGVA